MSNRKHSPKHGLLWGILIALTIIVALSLDAALHPASGFQPCPFRIVEVMTSNASALVNRDGILTDYIVVENTQDMSDSIGGWGLSDRSYQIRYLFPDISLQPGETRYVYFSKKGYALPEKKELYANWGLSSSGETLYLFNPQGVQVQCVEIPALGEDEAYLEDTGAWRIVQKDAGSKPVSLLCSGGGVFISEVIPDNGSYRVGDVPGFPDIIEICNGTDDTIDLSDYALSDTLSHPTLFSFESGCSLEPGAYALVACTKEAYLDTSLYSCAAFSLDSEGESLYLYRKSTQQIVDAVDIPALDVDCSYAREDDTWSVQQSPTPGYPNTALGIALTDAGLRSGNSSGIYISEVCSSNLSIALPNTEESSDFIELLNATDQDICLDGCSISNTPGQPRKYVFDQITIKAHETLLILCGTKDGKTASADALQASFRLNMGGCGVYLFGPDGSLMDRIRVPLTYSDTSYGRTLGESGLFYYDVPTPGGTNANGYIGYAASPELSLCGGMYESPVAVELSAPENAQIYYTLDGSIPDTGSTPYTGAIPINRTTTLRACAVSEGLAPSLPVTQTYFISTYHTLPVVALTTDPEHLWNEETGMLADGPLLDRQTQKRPWTQATYSKKTKYTGFVEYYDKDGGQQISQGMVFNCMGEFSLDMPQKSFSIEASRQFGSTSFQSALFEDRPFLEYHAFALRNGGQDGLYTRVLDGLQARLVEQCGSSVITQAWKPVIVYLNGQYWGHYNLRERVGIEMIAQHEGWNDPENIDLLEGDGTGSGNINHGSNEDYRALVRFAESHSLTDDPEALDYILSQFDLDNMLDYFFFEMFFGNEDSGNIRFYRNAVGGDGKWRYVLYDLDWGLFHSEYGGPAHVLNPEGMGQYHISSNIFIVRLLEVPEIRERFLTRSGQFFQTVLTTENMISLLDDMVAQIQPEMQLHFARWAGEMIPQINSEQPGNPEGAYQYWLGRIERAKNVMKKRPHIFWNMMKDYFELSEAEMKAYFGACPVMPADAK